MSGRTGGPFPQAAGAAVGTLVFRGFRGGASPGAWAQAAVDALGIGAIVLLLAWAWGRWSGAPRT